MKIEIPTNCPCCNYPLETVNAQLFCRNLSCEAQLYKKLEHFAKVLGIKGLGPKTIEKLALSDLMEIYYLDLDTAKEALGEKIAVKLLDEIEKSKVADFATVLAAFSIPLIGNTAATKLANVISTFDEITLETCKSAGLGDKASQNLCDWIASDYRELKEFLPFSFKPVQRSTVSADAPSICITGKLTSYKTKAEASKVLEAAGYRVVESVTKTLNYLVDEGDKGSSKRTKAEEYGVTIISNLNLFLKEN
jgi:DNA ligase (NAD+)